MDTYFEVEEVTTTRQDWITFKRARTCLIHQGVEILSQDQIRGEMLASEDGGNIHIAKACRTVYELWDAFEE